MNGTRATAFYERMLLHRRRQAIVVATSVQQQGRVSKKRPKQTTHLKLFT